MFATLWHLYSRSLQPFQWFGLETPDQNLEHGDNIFSIPFFTGVFVIIHWALWSGFNLNSIHCKNRYKVQSTRLLFLYYTLQFPLHQILMRSQEWFKGYFATIPSIQDLISSGQTDVGLLYSQQFTNRVSVNSFVTPNRRHCVCFVCLVSVCRITEHWNKWNDVCICVQLFYLAMII